MDAPLKGIILHSAQKQMLAFMHDVETKGVDVGSMFSELNGSSLCNLIGKPIKQIHSGILAADMGYGKTASIIALCVVIKIPTLIVAPQMGIEQWVEKFQEYAPHLKVRSLYCVDQMKTIDKILSHDVLIVAPTSRLMNSIQKWTRRVVIDEAHDVLAKKQGRSDVMKFLNWPNTFPMWAISGTPFLQIGDNQYFTLVRHLLQISQRTKIRHRQGITVDRCRQFILRMSRKLCDATGAPLIKIPEVTYKSLPVSLDDDERMLYKIACCIDGWRSNSLKTHSSYKTDMLFLNALHERMRARLFFLGEGRARLAEYLDHALKNVCASDIYPRDLVHAKLERLVWLTQHYSNRVVAKDSTKNVSADAVLSEVKRQRMTDPTFKAVFVTDSLECGRYVSKTWKGRVEIMQRQSGSNARVCHAALRSFQRGTCDILVCSNEAMQTGINLQEACHVFFVEQSIFDSSFQQACTRIARYGTRHTKLYATFVYAKDTVAEEIAQYHMRKRDTEFSKAIAPIVQSINGLLHHEETLHAHHMKFDHGAYVSYSPVADDLNTFDTTLTLSYAPVLHDEVEPTFYTLEDTWTESMISFTLTFYTSDSIRRGGEGKQLTSRVTFPNPAVAKEFLLSSPDRRGDGKNPRMKLFMHTLTTSGCHEKKPLNKYDLMSIVRSKICDFSGMSTFEACETAIIGNVREHKYTILNPSDHASKTMILKMAPILRVGKFIYEDAGKMRLRSRPENDPCSTLLLCGVKADLLFEKLDAGCTIQESPLRYSAMTLGWKRDIDRYAFDKEITSYAGILTHRHFARVNEIERTEKGKTFYMSTLVKLVEGKVGDIIFFTHQGKEYQSFVKLILQRSSTGSETNFEPHTFAIVTHTKDDTSFPIRTTPKGMEAAFASPHNLPVLWMDEAPIEKGVAACPLITR